MRHQFTLRATGLHDLTPEIANSLYEATGGEIELEITNGTLELGFDREARSLRAAIDAAIRDVEGVGLGLRVERVESEYASTIAEINAELTNAAGRH